MLSLLTYQTTSRKNHTVVTNDESVSNGLSTHPISLNNVLVNSSKKISADLVNLSTLYSLTYNNNNTNDFVNRQIAITKAKAKTIHF